MKLNLWEQFHFSNFTSDKTVLDWGEHRDHFKTVKDIENTDYKAVVCECGDIMVVGCKSFEGKLHNNREHKEVNNLFDVCVVVEERLNNINIERSAC